MILPDPYDNDYIPPIPNRKTKRMKKRKLVAVITGVALLSLVLTVGSSIAYFKFNTTLASNAFYHNNQNNQNDRNNQNGQDNGVGTRPQFATLGSTSTGG